MVGPRRNAPALRLVSTRSLQHARPRPHTRSSRKGVLRQARCIGASRPSRSLSHGESRPPLGRGSFASVRARILTPGRALATARVDLQERMPIASFTRGRSGRIEPPRRVEEGSTPEAGGEARRSPRPGRGGRPLEAPRSRAAAPASRPHSVGSVRGCTSWLSAQSTVRLMPVIPGIVGGEDANAAAISQVDDAAHGTGRSRAGGTPSAWPHARSSCPCGEAGLTAFTRSVGSQLHGHGSVEPGCRLRLRVARERPVPPEASIEAFGG